MPNYRFLNKSLVDPIRTPPIQFLNLLLGSLSKIRDQIKKYVASHFQNGVREVLFF